MVGVPSQVACGGLEKNATIEDFQKDGGTGVRSRWYGNVIVLKIDRATGQFIDFKPSDICFVRTYFALRSP